MTVIDVCAALWLRWSQIIACTKVPDRRDHRMTWHSVWSKIQLAIDPKPSDVLGDSPEVQNGSKHADYQ